ncbi:MurR/RpiR family transcriptional regulator [Bacillus pakistanensis]|nr:MurR/RpiR family transcriptional regulator [Bacillus pakistanensis]
MISNLIDELPSSERKIAEYILEHPGKVIKFTTAELAEKSNTSAAAVIRLCKSLGIKRFTELKVRLAGDLANKDDSTGYRDISANESLYSIIEKSRTNSIQSINETAELIQEEMVQKAIHVLEKAKNIHLFGIGASHIISLDAQQKFLRIKKNATAFSDLHLVATLIANSSEDDVVFGISYSGETEEVAKVLKLAKEKGAKTISLTKYGGSKVANITDISLHTSFTREAPFRSGATSSRLAQLFMIDVLFLGLSASRYEDTVTYIDRTRESIHTLKKL